MVNVLSLATAAAAASIAIVDHTQNFAVDLIDIQCDAFTAVQHFAYHKTPAQVWRLNAVNGTQNQFKVISELISLLNDGFDNFKQIQHVQCGSTLSWAGSTSGAIAQRSQTVARYGADTAFTITPVNASSPTGPFRFTETLSGTALNAWEHDSTQDTNSGPITFERSRDADPRQMFYFTTPGTSPL
ncbi:hypothetical protein VKT23_006243 [Stygiomarasmius scandens]|uniref:Uncharacterized protein n=1 Tax=Marasmiellus scandens TaxID=2682957 RepID=A0ABR1JRW7_9AGAR